MNSAKKNADQGACSHTVHDFSTFLPADISQAKKWGAPYCCLFHALDIPCHTALLIFLVILRFSYRMKILPIVVPSYFINKNTPFVM